MAAESEEALYRELVSQWRGALPMLAPSEPNTLVADPAAWPGMPLYAERMMAVDTLTYLPDDILVKVDRAAMAASLETRVPFLDERVISFAWGLPFEQKVRNGQGKWLLRQLLYRYVPQNYGRSSEAGLRRTHRTLVARPVARLGGRPVIARSAGFGWPARPGTNQGNVGKAPVGAKCAICVVECADVPSLEKTMGLRVCQLCAVDFSLKHFLLPLIDGMQSHGWNVTAVCSDGPEIPGMRARGYEIDTIPISRSLNVFKHAISVVRLVAYFRRERFDILHVHTPVAALVARVAAFIARVPVVVYTAHGFYFHDEMPAWKRRLFVSLERFAGRFTDLLFTQSAEDADTAVQEGISPAADTLAIGNGVDARRFDPA